MRLGAIAVLIATSLGALGARQNPPAPQTFRSRVDLVTLDVTVLDKNRQPVRGLSQADFIVRENDQPREIQAFSAVDLPDDTSTTTASTWLRSVTPDVITNRVPETGRVFVIVLDDALMPDDLGAVENARKGAEAFVMRMGPDDLAAVVFTMYGHGAQGLTSDRGLLLKAVNSLPRLGNTTLGALPTGPCYVKTGNPRSPSCPLPTCGHYISSIRVVGDSANYLAALPGRRKAIVYISGGMGVDLGGERITGPVMGASPEVRSGCGGQVKGEVDRAFDYAARANVAIYGIDPMGLRIDGTLDSASGQVVQYLQVMSDNTGGHAIVNTNDLSPGVAQIFRENSSYYLLGYLPADTKADGSIHRIDVKVNRPDVEVVSRRLYYAPKPPKANATPPPPNVTALGEIVPDSAWPMRIALAPVLTPDGKTTVAIALGLERPASPDRVTDHIELTVKAFTPEGDARGTVRSTVAIQLPPSSDAAGESRFDVLAQLPLAPGRHEFRVSAHDTETDKRGSVYADVDVPDFASLPLSLSGVLLSSPNESVAPRLAFDNVVPVLPTTERTFAATDRVSAFVRVYQSAKAAAAPATITVRTLDAKQQAVTTQKATIAADVFAGRHTADVTYPVPVAKLTTGEYVLRIEATTGKATATRDVRFAVK